MEPPGLPVDRVSERDLGRQKLQRPGIVRLDVRRRFWPQCRVDAVADDGQAECSHLGAQLVLGVTTSPLHSLVQGAGKAWRIPARTFRGELARSSSLRRNLHRYLYVLMAQQSVSSACLRFHLTGQRLARWLLMCQDRACADSFHVTQEFLAYMLGMRRVGITAAAGMLQQDGLIAYARGKVTVLNRHGLEAAACSCYAEDRNAYTQLLG